VNKGFIIRRLKTNLSVWTWLRFDLNFVYEKALLWQRNESMAIFFVSAQNPRPIYEISITFGFYLTVSFTSEDKYAMNEGWRSEELIIYYAKIVRFTVGIINKSLIIPTEDWRQTSFGPNDLKLISRPSSRIKFWTFVQKSKTGIKIIWFNWLKEWRKYNLLLCFLSK
jgi:hypothetical protein